MKMVKEIGKDSRLLVQYCEICFVMEVIMLEVACLLYAILSMKSQLV